MAGIGSGTPCNTSRSPRWNSSTSTAARGTRCTAPTRAPSSFVSSAWLRAHLSLVPRRLDDPRAAGRRRVHRGAAHRDAPDPAPARCRSRASCASRRIRWPTIRACCAGPAASATPSPPSPTGSRRRRGTGSRCATCTTRGSRARRTARHAIAACALRQGAPAVCYQLDLPATYDAFLQRLSKPTRRATKRGLKMLDELGAGRVTFAPDGDPDVHIEAVVRLELGALGREHASARAASKSSTAPRSAKASGGSSRSGTARARSPRARRWSTRLTSTYGFALVGHDPQYERMSPGKAVLALLDPGRDRAGLPHLRLLARRGRVQEVVRDAHVAQPGFRARAAGAARVGAARR